jgi:hypothetical protein
VFQLLLILLSLPQVDNPQLLPAEAYGGLEPVPSNFFYQEALKTLRYSSSSWMKGYWTSDTRVQCGSPAHIALVAALGIPGVLFFSLGLPVGLWVYLSRINKQTVDGRCRLEDSEVKEEGSGWIELKLNIRTTQTCRMRARHCISMPLPLMLHDTLQSQSHNMLCVHFAGRCTRSVQTGASCDTTTSVNTTTSQLPAYLYPPTGYPSSSQVELQFGAVYEKYRYSCYYWECIILLEAFTLTLLLVLLTTQNNAPLQVLVAMAVIFIEAVLHVSYLKRSRANEGFGCPVLCMYKLSRTSACSSRVGVSCSCMWGSMQGPVVLNACFRLMSCFCTEGSVLQLFALASSDGQVMTRSQRSVYAAGDILLPTL